MTQSNSPAAGWQFTVKRCLDFVVAVWCLVLLSPILALIAMLVRLTPGPIIFRQKRLGHKGHVFSIYKFRTMVDNAWRSGDGLRVVKGDSRVTRVGKVLRALHLDELPQLANVVKGDMALIGPRPALPFHFDHYHEWEKQRLVMLPGITGWAQVKGGNALNWDQRIELDVWYVKHWSLLLDLKIVGLTIVHLVARSFGGGGAHTAKAGTWTRGFPDDPFTHSQEHLLNSETEKKA